MALGKGGGGGDLSNLLQKEGEFQPWGMPILYTTLWPSIFHILNPRGIKLLTRLRVGLSNLHEHKFRHCFQDSNLHEHKFRHCFQDTLYPLCQCGKDIESTMHFFLHCTNFLIPRQTLFQKIKNIDDNILSQSEMPLTQALLYGNQNYHTSINRLIEYLVSTERFKYSLFN